MKLLWVESLKLARIRMEVANNNNNNNNNNNILNVLRYGTSLTSLLIPT